MSKKVSVIIPVYNTERFLVECLDSVLSQSLKDIEVICVDDGSTDSSPDILHEYKKKDSRIKVIHQEHSAPGNARNAGFDIAQGDYISFIDSDDYVDRMFLEKLYSKAVETESDIVIANVFLYYMDTESLQLFHDAALYTFLKNKVFSIVDYPELIRILAPWDRIYKKSFLNNYSIRMPEDTIYEDRLYAVKCLVYAQRITVVNEPLYYYRKNAGQAITDIELKQSQFRRDYLEMTKECLLLMQKENLYCSLSYDYLINHFENCLMHQKSIKDKNEFAYFFNYIHDMITDADYKVAKSMPYPEIVKYCGFLQENNLNKCYHYFRKRF
jgi:glycosyltransferase involved in cell wall biosynthesis